jgi:hypothetical protein
MSIEDSVDRAGRRRLNNGKLFDQLVTNLGGAPTPMFPFDSQDRLLNLEWRFIGMSIRASGPVFQPTNAKILIAIKYLIAGLTGDTKFPAYQCHFLTIEKPGYKLESFIHSVTLFPRHLESSPKCLNCVTYVPGITCNLCVGKFNALLLCSE